MKEQFGGGQFNPEQQPSKVVPIGQLAEKPVFEAPKHGLPVNKINRAANVAIAHGVFVGGIYRDHGIPRPAKSGACKKK